MLEAKVVLQFITPCLGGIRGPDIDRFDRDADGNVVFMQSWFRELLVYGARAFGKHQGEITAIRIHPRIQGTPKIYRRYYGPSKYKDHEAFLVGDCITLRAMLVDGMSITDFEKILKLAGGYKGISPYRWQDGFGRFTVKVDNDTRRER